MRAYCCHIDFLYDIDVELCSKLNLNFHISFFIFFKENGKKYDIFVFEIVGCRFLFMSILHEYCFTDLVFKNPYFTLFDAVLDEF